MRERYILCSKKGIKSIKTFSLKRPQEVICGVGALSEAASAIKNNFDPKRVCIITDSFLNESGIVEKIAQLLREVGIEVFIWPNVRPNPLLSGVDESKDFFIENQCEGFIGLGGGSSMDIARAAAGLATFGGKAIDYFDKGMGVPTYPIVTIPTTTGTGAESTLGGIFVNDETGIKGGIGGGIIPRLTIIDPELHTGMPSKLTAATGMDALVHAYEAYNTCKKNNPLSDMLASTAIRLISENVRKAYANADGHRSVR